MQLDSALLPDDAAALRAIILAQRVEIAGQRNVIAHLRPQLTRLRCMQFGRGQFRVIRYVRPRWSYRRCERITGAPAPSLAIARGRATAGLLAHGLVAKYADHLPLYRQSGIYAREGVELDHPTLSDWVGGSAALLRSLVDALGRHVLSGSVLHADDTPIPVLTPGTSETRTGRLWTHLRNERPHASGALDLLWDSGEVLMMQEDLDEAAETVHEGI